MVVTHGLKCTGITTPYTMHDILFVGGFCGFLTNRLIEETFIYLQIEFTAVSS